MPESEQAPSWCPQAQELRPPGREVQKVHSSAREEDRRGKQGRRVSQALWREDWELLWRRSAGEVPKSQGAVSEGKGRVLVGRAVLGWWTLLPAVLVAARFGRGAPAAVFL